MNGAASAPVVEVCRRTARHHVIDRATGDVAAPPDGQQSARVQRVHTLLIWRPARLAPWRDNYAGDVGPYRFARTRRTLARTYEIGRRSATARCLSGSGLVGDVAAALTMNCRDLTDSSAVTGITHLTEVQA